MAFNHSHGCERKGCGKRGVNSSEPRGVRFKKLLRCVTNRHESTCFRNSHYYYCTLSNKSLIKSPWIQREGRNEVEFPRCFRTLVVKIEKTNSNSTRDFSKRINFTRVDLFVWSTLVVKIKKRRNPLRSVFWGKLPATKRSKYVV